MTIDMFAKTAPPSAVISDCGRYRYRLDRTWSDGPRICWIMCNPSTADADVDDPTIRKITGYSRRWKFGSLVVVNLWAWRSTDPSALPFAGDVDVVGPHADGHINYAIDCSDRVVCAWGRSVHHRHRSARESYMIGRIQCAGFMPMALKINADGSPAHPLYQPGAANLVVMPW